MKKRLSQVICGLILGAFLLAQLPAFATDRAAYAGSGAPEVLRVAFPQVEGFSTTDANGNHHGLVVDWLNEIAKYTGWEYEYVDTSGEALIDEFMQGKFDLMGGTYYVDSMKEILAYPDYSTGSSKSVLLARWDDDSIRGYDYTDLEGKTVGVFERAKENVRRLNEFLSMNGIHCDIRTFRVEDTVNGNLYRFLENGEVDLLLGNASDDSGQFRTVATFDAQPHYIVTTPNQPEVLAGLNWAMGRILESNPNFAQTCYEDNFPDVGIHNYRLNQEESAYVREKEVVTVAVPESFHPFFCMDDTGVTHDGMVPNFLAQVTAFSGLEFHYIFADTYAGAIELMQTGEADLLGFFLGDEAQAAQSGLSLTTPYATLSSLVVRHKSVTYPSAGLSCALLKGRLLPDSIQAEPVYFDTAWDMLQAVNSGRVDFAYGLSAQLENVLQQNVFSNTIPVSIPESSNDICFALARPAKPELLTILNKAINGLPNKDKVDIVEANLVSAGQRQLSLQQMIYANPVAVISAVTVILLLAVAITIIAARGRVKAARIRSEKERAEASSRAKSEFLSRMSHEIRTPMNAVVGIADLMSTDCDAETMQTYLDKLRTSSRYLLNLINDILDMSRIDSEMMTIASEPFSLEQMLDEVESMLRSEAERRQINMSVDVELSTPACRATPSASNRCWSTCCPMRSSLRPWAETWNCRYTRRTSTARGSPVPFG